METKGQTVLQQIKNQKGLVKATLQRYRSRITSDLKLLAYIYYDHSLKHHKTNANEVSIMVFLSHFANKHFGNPTTMIRARRDVEKENPELNFTEQVYGNFNVHERTKAQLEKCRPCRNSDLKLIMALWLDDARFHKLDPNVAPAQNFLKLMHSNNVTNPVSIIRERRKIEKKHPELRGDTKKARNKEAEEVRAHYSKKK